MKRFILTILFYFIFPVTVFSAGTLAGTVLDSSGNPVESASISVYRNGVLRFSGTTDSSGEYSITVNKYSWHDVECTKAGFQTQAQSVKPQNNKTVTLNFSLVGDPGNLVGTCRIENTTTPVVGATVTVRQGNVVYGTTTTNGSGTYTIATLAPGPYDVIVEASGLQTKVLAANITSGEITDLDFFLSSGVAAISGTVTIDSPAVGLPGAVVELLQNGVFLISDETDSNGDYSFSNIAPGSYTVKCSHPLYQQVIEGAILVAGSTTTVDFALELLPGTIVGTVTSSPQGLALDQVFCQVAKDNSPVSSTLTDTKGQYTIGGLRPGVHVIHTSKEGYSMRCSAVNVLAGQIVNENFMLPLESIVIIGTVSDETTGLAIKGASVQLLLDDNLVISTISDNNGEFRISGVCLRRYNMVVKADGYQGQVFAISTPSGETTTIDTALVSNPSTLMGTVTDQSTSLPIASAAMSVRIGNEILDVGITDASGNYTFNGMPDGIVRIHVHKDNYQAKFTTNTISAGSSVTNDFALVANPATITGLLTNGVTGGAVPNGLITLVRSDGITTNSTLAQITGRYIFTKAAPGDYRFELRLPDYIPVEATEEFTAIADESVTQNIVMYPQDVPPSDLTGRMRVVKFATQVDRVKICTWVASLSPEVVGYNVYRDGVFIATTDASTLTYEDHGRPYDTDEVYQVKSLNSDGSESSAVRVVIR